MANVSVDVLEFYRALPFNYREGPRDHAETIRANDQLQSYPPLRVLLKKGTTLLDVGCGAGWLGLSAAYHYRCKVTGIDFNPTAIDRARAVAEALRLSVELHTADLFSFEAGAKFDVVASLGVLHHTHDCPGALAHICAKYVRPGGHAFIGLYHRYGRRPFLEHFRRMRAEGASEEAMLARYRRLHASLSDETQLRSWFRDQVLHPHETQHTLGEMLPVLEAADMRLISTSINGFQPISDIADVLWAEPALEQVAKERLEQNRYFPGFFVFLARKSCRREG
jgi:2-polyprenyl-3-methyl-5-hydroxy-6-metoxy-1,4-benzoquinol methylase